MEASARGFELVINHTKIKYMKSGWEGFDVANINVGHMISSGWNSLNLK